MAKKDSESEPTVRLRNINTGAVVEVPERKVTNLGSEWEADTGKSSGTTRRSSSSTSKS